jgi:hypothetical protein
MENEIGDNEILICPYCDVQHKLLRIPSGEYDDLEIGCHHFKAICSGFFKDAEQSVRETYNEGVLIRTYKKFHNLD